MALISLRKLLDHAAENNYGVPAFNVNNLEQIQAIMLAAKECNSPVILQASAGARKYAGESFLKYLLQATLEEYPKIPVVIHQDHGVSPAVCIQAIKLGFSSVMMDGSLMTDGKTPSSYEYNVKVTRDVVSIAHSVNVSVEGELGCLGSLETGQGDKEDGHGFDGTLSKEQLLTNPIEAKEFVEATNVDQAIPNTHLVMHGSSSVPQEWLEIIRQNGGNIKETYGVPTEEIQQAIKYGVRKINIDTDIRLAMTGAIRKYLNQYPDHFDPRQYLIVARDAAKKICLDRFIAFGSANNASKII
jgi:fructose-bisphosphate aldolase class II